MQRDCRVDPSELSEEELKQLQPILNLAKASKRPSLKASDGSEVKIPQPVLSVLAEIVTGMQEGKAMLLVPEDQLFTTQSAASYLGMSRQHLVNLLESGTIPFHRVGSHRRVFFRDLRAYANRRDKERRAGLSRLFHTLRKQGQYDVELEADAE